MKEFQFMIDKLDINSTPIISIIICAKNASPYINESIHSILRQTLTNIEIIIIENGSEDDTWEKIQLINDSRIKKFQTNLPQLTFNLNYALMHAQGKYIARMDADDIAAEDRLSLQIKFLEENQEIGVVGTFIETFGSKAKVVSYPTTNKGILLAMPFRASMAHPTVIIRAEILRKLGGYHGLKFAEDLDLWLACARAGVPMANLPIPLLKYRLHADQARGRREAYASATGTLLKHCLLTGNPLYLLGALLTAMKMIVLGR